MACAVSPARLLSLFVLTFPVAVAAQEPQSSSPTTRRIPYSAVLPGAGPDGAAGARSVTFALFDGAEGGTLLWSETQIVSVDARGRYSAHLGAVMALPLEIFRTEQARWLEVSIDGRAQPRVMLVAVPYALRAADAETLGGTPASQFVRTDANGRRVRPDGTAVDDPLLDGSGVSNQLAKWADGDTLSSSVVTESFDNRIGILAPDPTGGGVVDSRFTIRHLDNNTAIGVLNTSNQRRFALNTLSNGGFQFFDGGGGTWNAGMTQVNGNVGIGTFPDTRLRIAASNVDGVRITQDTMGRHALRGVAPVGSAALIGITSDTVNDVFGTNAGVQGWTDSGGAGVLGSAASGVGVRGTTTTGVAIQGQTFGSGLAGHFNGNVSVSGTLTKGGGAFEIDHPLDPANKYLRHSFVESPDMMNVYNGNVTLDAQGEAWILLPDWFEVLNRDFRYQLTSIGGPATPYVASKVANNRFKIGGGIPGGEVSWQITGIRQDAWANTHRIQVEENKKGDDAGRYLHPDAYGLGSEMAVPSARPNAGVVVRKEIR